MFDKDEIESPGVEPSEIGGSLTSPVHLQDSSFRCDLGLSSSVNGDLNEEIILQWAAINKLPTVDRLRSSMFGEINQDENGHNGRKAVDVAKLTATEKHTLIDRLIKHIENDNLRLLHKMRKRTDRVGVDLPTIEVRCKDLSVEVQCRVVDGKPLQTLWNSLTSMLLDITRLSGLSQKAQVNIISDVSCVIRPGRMTLLLGPPGCGKTTLLKALSGNLDNSIKVSGEISYNGYKLDEFVVQKTSAYISQHDLHIPEMTVRETLDFSALCQGIGSRAKILTDLTRREKEAKIIPDSDIDTYMKAISVEGQKAGLQTNYIMKILGLDICADTLIGDAMSRGISGGQKKRLTTGEMIVGPIKTLFMDEISNGLDSSTTYQVICCLQQLSHIADATVLVSLLQPAPEAFDLFDDIILMGEGKIVYHGARCDALEFFKSCGFSCPERKGVADFLQEERTVISRKDQEQYWQEAQQPYSYISVDMFSKKYKDSTSGRKLSKELSLPFDKSKGHKDAIIFSMYSLPKWTLFRACISREILLLRRNSFVHIFKSVQLVIVALISMTLFLRTHMGIDIVHANNYIGAIYFSLVLFLFDGWPELSMTVARLPVFYRQKELYFYPAWAYAIPTTMIKIPLSLLVAVVWTSLTYYTIGYTPEPGRFFRQIILLFAAHVAFSSMYRFIASVFRSVVASAVAASLIITFCMLFSGFNIPRPSMPIWLKWTFWISPLSYGMIGLSGNEFLAPRWQKELSGGTTVGVQTLDDRGFNFGQHLFWISVAALFAFAVLFNIAFVLALSLLKAPGSLAFISSEKLSQLQKSKEPDDNCQDEEHSGVCAPSTYAESLKGRMVLPFEPLNIVFENVQYFVDTPVTMKERGFTPKRLKLLSNITGSFRPGVLTAVMGVSGAGKTTLLDVLSGRKTSGIVEGEIRIGGYPKVQSTFARISGYCEQTDIHSPHVTVKESVIFSAWLRLHASIDPQTKYEFVQEVLETIELDEIKDSLVGVPGVDGLSIEQRKRLTIAVEFVANPSIILMDEPTTGLDARAAAVVMRAVKNVANTGRTVVCTIHQPSTDIFEAFDELVLLKTGGSMIYSGPLGRYSSKVIEYFEGISGVPKIRDNYNPATWMLEVTSNSSETELGIDFSQIYENSSMQMANNELVRMLRTPSPGSNDLQFPSCYSQNGWGQFRICIWKQHWSYWRSPSYNLTRLSYTLFSVFFYGFLFWGQGKKIHNQQSLLTLLASIFTSVLSCGITNSSTVLPYVSAEQSVFYRERFAGMYSSWAYSAAQVIIETPYLFVQAAALTVITYPMIGYYWSAYKVFWYFYTTFCTLLYFTYLGMLLIPITPSFPVASILQTALYTTFDLFAGFFIPRSQIPKWWTWLYYLAPTSWTLKGILTSQFGDVEDEILAFGETKTVAAFMRDYFGYDQNMLPLVAVILILYPIVFAYLFAYFVGKVNFLKR